MRVCPDDCIPVRVRGIPMLVYIESYTPPDPGHPGVHDRKTGDLIDPGHPPSPEEIEWTLCDRKGYPARWMERRLDKTNIQDIEDQIKEHQQRMAAESSLD